MISVPGVKDPFSQLIRRHTRLATIMRVAGSTNLSSVDPFPDGLDSSMGDLKPYSTPVKAYLPAAPDMSLRTADLQPRRKPTVEMGDSRQDIPIHRSEMGSQGSQPEPQRSPEEHPARDAVWERLQLIHRLHTQREQVEDTQPTMQDQSTPLQGALPIPSGLTQDSKPEVEAEAPMDEDLDDEISPLPLRADSQAPRVAGAGESVEDLVNKGHGPRDLSTPKELKPTTPEHPSTRGEEEGVASSHKGELPAVQRNRVGLEPTHKPISTPVVQRQPGPDTDQSENLSNELPGGWVEEPDEMEHEAGEPLEVGDLGPEREDRQEIGHHQEPLQAAWPVERIDSTEQNIEAPLLTHPGSHADPEPRQDIAPVHSLPYAEQVSGILQGIEPAEPTGSSIELIAVKGAPPKKGGRPPEDGFPLQSMEKSPLERLPGVREQPGLPAEDEGLTHPVETATDVSESRTLRVQTAPEQPNGSRSVELQPVEEPQVMDGQPGYLQEGEFVLTEIGPLPVDLWELIGQEPPIDQVSGEDSGLEQSAPSSGKHGLADYVIDSSQTRPPGRTAGSPVVELAEPEFSGQRLVQRRSERQPPREADQGEESETGESQEEAEEINLRELARQVYAEVRRRLTIENERLRRV